LPSIGSGGKVERGEGEGEKTEGEGPFAGGPSPNWRCRYHLPPAPPPGIAQDFHHSVDGDPPPPPTRCRFLTGLPTLPEVPANRHSRWEDMRLYNYSVPVIGRSKLRFPVLGEQEYAARAQRAALR